MILELVDFLRDYQIPTRSIDAEIDSPNTGHSSEIIVVKIDHMRNSSAYVKTLKSWTEMFSLRSVLFVSRDRGLILLSEGRREDLNKLVIAWKTENVDVDSKGKPCKEKMLQVLLREPCEPLVTQKSSFQSVETTCFIAELHALGLNSELISKLS